MARAYSHASRGAGRRRRPPYPTSVLGGRARPGLHVVRTRPIQVLQTWDEPVDTPEARSLLRKELEALRSLSYAELADRLDKPATHELRGESGVTYQLEFQVFWDHRPGGNLRVRGSIDDRGLRSLLPLTEDFIVAPDGSFVGE